MEMKGEKIDLLTRFLISDLSSKIKLQKKNEEKNRTFRRIYSNI